MGRKKPRWADKPEFAWTPEPPLCFEPRVAGAFPPEPGQASPTPLPAPWPPRNRALKFSPLLQRLALAAAQGTALTLLLEGRSHHWWPDNGIVAGLILAAAVAPLLAIQGLRRIAARALLLWTGSAALFLFALGFYQHWRAAGAVPDSSGLAQTVMTGTILFMGQALMLAHGGRRTASYRALYRASWGLAIQLAVCALCAASLWIIGFVFPAAGPALPIAAAVVAALVMQGLGGAALRPIQDRLAFLLAAMLPVLILFSMAAILLWSLTRWLPPLAISAGTAGLMILGINASYRDGAWRPGWRRHLEFAGAILLSPLAILAMMALHARVSLFGFTADRVMALALVLLLSAYALIYAGAALISLGGGRAMERLETGNLVMAFVAAAALAAMATPLADPVRLAVAEQNWRLDHGAVAPGKFDYAWRRRAGLCFGHERHADRPSSVPELAPDFSTKPF